MANRILLPRALASDGSIVPGALAYFYTEGTTTPLTVYSDEALSAAVSAPLVADSSGNFAATYTSAGVKIDIRDPSTSTSLPGYPSDNWHVTSTDETGASAITFTPISGNSATNVQTAIANITALWNAVTSYGKSLIAAADAAAARTLLGLGGLATLDVLDEDDMATDSATRPPSQQSVKAFVENKRFTSAAQIITTAGTVTVAHGLGVRPLVVTYRLVCTDAGGDAGYAQDDEIMVDFISTDNATSRINTATVTATNISVRFSAAAACFVAGDKSTGAMTALTNTKWNLYIEAMA